MRKIKSFTEHFNNKKLAEEIHQKNIVEEKRKKELKEETATVGWDALLGKPEMVDDYIKWITR